MGRAARPTPREEKDASRRGWRHWQAIRFLRKDYEEQGETATLRRISVVGGIPTKQLFQLFPQKPAKKLAYIAGLPKPYGCV